MSKSSEFSKTSLKNSLVEGPAEHKTQDWAFGRVASGILESYRDQEPQQIYHVLENDKKRLYSKRVLDVEHSSFMPLVFTPTGEMGKECIR